MGNHCSIFHADFDRLISLTGSHNKAVFLDKCLFWWQISTYTLGDNKIWFTRKLADIARDTFLSERTVSRYLEAFEKEGLLERTSKLSSSGKGGIFTVTKRLYIRVTDKLLHLISMGKMLQEKMDKPKDDSIFLEQDGEIDKARMATSIYKDKYYNHEVNSTVSHAGFVDNFKKADLGTSNHSSGTSVESLIGERITDRLKNYIKGMLKNVQGQYDLKFSDPDRLLAEVIFSVTQEQQWKGVANPHHRVNIIARLLKQKQWKTPKGFYNHWDVGQWFRNKDNMRMDASRKMKLEENQHAAVWFGKSRAVYARFDEPLQDEHHCFPELSEAGHKKIENTVHALDIKIRSEESYLKQLEVWFSEKNPAVSQSLINSVAMKIAGFYERREEILSGNQMEAA